MPKRKSQKKLLPRWTLVGPFAKTGAVEPVIFVDRGARLRKRNEGLAVGDGDSHSGHLDVFLNPKKDYSDLAYALSVIPPPFEKIYLKGFLGGRRDHELMNLAEVHRFLKAQKQVECAFDSAKVYAFSRGEFSLNLRGGFSLFAFEPVKLKLHGKVEYTLSGALKSCSSHGLSNRASGEIRLKTTGPIFLFKFLS